ncbi:MULTISPECIES: alginate export family protein [Brenneria]|uniref:Alginate export domain-containing protein n=1 Tax=Brenneria nigrifluens DSM 30175 = ATCC 13028 TaxID=1121120 RepID=A0A2U1UR16_9GAMM|nr:MULTISPECIES: alginate export family protein [Brenneria]EHD22213.1 hypothetical protein BrE312_2840 [Brenneria sp. EniD312]PWC24044.1 hypothetical protein DDT54_10820 [Brenneria nigrifluens DSM 30175 = ATCC 13028]QCR05237.1 hypothetical protein EH206_14215 [Brenneria nigrifluens DSM 30175 = ATCC 13028]
MRFFFYIFGYCLFFISSFSFSEDISKKQIRNSPIDGDGVNIPISEPTKNSIYKSKNKKTNSDIAPENSPFITADFTLKLTGERFHNAKLRRGDKKETESEWGPMLRTQIRTDDDYPLFAFAELEWEKTVSRETGEDTERKTTLTLNQAYLGINDLLPDGRIRLGRWLLRDEREWLFDENLDGVHARWRHERWRIEALGGRVNHWQRDLLDSSTKNDSPVNTGAVLVRRKMADEWLVGLYGVWQRDTAAQHDRQLNLGVRSHSNAEEGWRHWLELGMVRGRQSGADLRGYAVDVGATYRLSQDGSAPRITLGYAWGSGGDGDDDGRRRKHYRQTGLQSNEATFGGEAKFKIYGETFDPQLTNMHILTAGVGFNITPRATVDLVYHHYRQDKLAPLADNAAELSPRDDQRSTRTLGSELDLVVGWEPRDNIKVESAVGWFRPSERFRTPSGPRSADAYSAWLEVEVGF